MRFSVPTLSLKRWMQVLVSVTVVLYALTQYTLNYRYIQQLNEEQIAQVNDLVSANLRTMLQFPLATNHQSDIVRIVDEVFVHDMIWGIEVRAKDNQIIVRRERESDTDAVTLNKREIVIVDAHTPLYLDPLTPSTAPEQNLLGFVSLYFTDDEQINRLNTELLWQTGLFGLVVLVATWLAASLFSNFSRFVRQTNDEMQRLIDGEYAINIKRSNVQEFNTLAAKLEEVANALSHQVHSLKSSQEEAENKRLEAEQSQAIKDNFLQIVSHEIRSPVHVIVNLFDSITRDIQSHNISDIDTRLALVKESAHELLHVVDEFLDAEALANGQVNIKTSQIVLNETLTTICRKHQTKFQQKGINYVYEPVDGQDDVCALIDLGKLDRILSNLISNAYKYTQKGAVSVSWKITLAPTSTLAVYVKDSGIGMSEQEQTRIFERFYQVKSPKIRKHAGRGIGLALVQDLVSLLDGDIKVESTPKRGSTFTVVLPIQISQTVASGAPVSVDAPFNQECRVLIIDDNYANCVVMMEMLQQYEITPDYATDPNVGLDKAVRHTFDVILVDYHMPDLDGATLAKSIRDSEYSKNAVIMCITADATESAQTHLTNSDCFDAVLVKPIDAAQLAERIEQAMYAKSFSTRLYQNR